MILISLCGDYHRCGFETLETSQLSASFLILKINVDRSDVDVNGTPLKAV